MSLDLSFMENGEGSPLVVLHGLFGSARNWSTLSRRFGEHRHVYALDLRNHGGSPWAEGMSYPEMAGDIQSFIEGRWLTPAAVLGHSMGGKVAMLLALEHPDEVERLIVADIAPVGYRHTLMPYVQAMRAVDLDKAGRRGEVDAQLRTAVPEAGIRSFLLQNLVSEDGKLSWRINLPVLETDMPTITGFPEDPGWRPYEGPVLFLHGARSNYVLPEYEETIRHLFPRARLEAIPDAGHWLHAEQPDRFAEKVLAFLDEPA